MPYLSANKIGCGLRRQLVQPFLGLVLSQTEVSLKHAASDVFVILEILVKSCLYLLFSVFGRVADSSPACSIDVVLAVRLEHLQEFLVWREAYVLSSNVDTPIVTKVKFPA